MRRCIVISLGALALGGCDRTTGPGLPPPENLSYRLDVSGEPSEPAGILWSWDPVVHPDLEVYHVYSRPDQASVYGLRAATTSTTFHDAGQPHLQYFVVAADAKGRESERSEAVVVDERLRLEQPAWLVTTSLNRAVHLAWSDNPFTAAPDGFSKYHVYSASYTLGEEFCGEPWFREGTTIAPEFLASALPNGRPRCFAVSAESVEGWESLRSPIHADTPRPDARNVVVWAFDVDQAKSGFRFFLDADGDGQASAAELGIVTDGARADVDFRFERDVDGNFFFAPVRSGTQVALYGGGPVADLTSIDEAPEGGYTTAAVQAWPRHGYVFQMTAGDPYARFGAVRVTHVGREFVIFDWSYQTDPGNPELSVGGGLYTGSSQGIVVGR